MYDIIFLMYTYTDHVSLKKKIYTTEKGWIIRLLRFVAQRDDTALGVYILVYISVQKYSSTIVKMECPPPLI